MVKEDTVYLTFKKNTPYYNVGVRRHSADTDGFMLTNEFPTIRIKEEDLRDFKVANKYGLKQGLVIQVDEDNLDWDLNNALTDEQANELLKNYPKLKSTLQVIDSAPIVQKLLQFAEEQDKPKKTVSLIRARLDEVSEVEQDFVRPEDMQGVK